MPKRYAALLALISANGLFGCDHNPKPNVRHDYLPIEYNRLWSSDTAAEGARMNCRRDGLSNCEGESEPVIEAREQEEQFFERFTTAFLSNPACSGLSLHPFGPMYMQYKNLLNYKATDPRFTILMTFSLDHDTQEWTMVHDPDNGIKSAGKGTAREMAQDICSIAKQAGGKMEIGLTPAS